MSAKNRSRAGGILGASLAAALALASVARPAGLVPPPARPHEDGGPAIKPVVHLGSLLGPCCHKHCLPDYSASYGYYPTRWRPWPFGAPGACGAALPAPGGGPGRCPGGEPPQLEMPRLPEGEAAAGRDGAVRITALTPVTTLPPVPAGSCVPTADGAPGPVQVIVLPEAPAAPPGPGVNRGPELPPPVILSETPERADVGGVPNGGDLPSAPHALTPRQRIFKLLGATPP
jgi:hypothetical protein